MSEMTPREITETLTRSGAQLPMVHDAHQGLLALVELCHGLAVHSGWWSDPATG